MAMTVYPANKQSLPPAALWQRIIPRPFVRNERKLDTAFDAVTRHEVDAVDDAGTRHLRDSDDGLPA